MDKLGAKNLTSMSQISSAKAPAATARSLPTAPQAPLKSGLNISAKSLDNLNLSGKLGNVASTVMCPDW